MLAGFEIKVDTGKALKKIGIVKSDLATRAYLKLVLQRFVNWVNENFEKEGAENKWKPMSVNTYVNRRVGEGGEGPFSMVRLLRDTGRMAQSFVPGRPGTLSRVDIAGGYVAIGSQEKKAGWHHFGTQPYVITPREKSFLQFRTVHGIRRAKQVNHPGLPSRPLLPSEQLARTMAENLLGAYIERLTQRAKT